MVEEKKQTLEKTQFKVVRYLINSVSELRDSLNTLNLIFSRSQNENDFFEMEQKSRFDIIPLPDTLSRFLLCLDVPRDLLGHEHDETSNKLDFSCYNLQEKRISIEYKDENAILSFNINTLLELNIAFHQIEAAINIIDDKKIMNKILQLFFVQMKPRTDKCDYNVFQIIIPKMSAEHLELIKNKITSANLISSNTPI